MTLHGKTAFVTGGTGFIGGRLIEVLTAQYGMRVRALVRNNHATPGSYRIAGCGAEIFQGDICDPQRMKQGIAGCDFVFHCAFGNSGDTKRDQLTTVGGTQTVAGAAGANSVQHFVNLSTMVVFGDAPETADESFIPNKLWKWPYPHQKREAEAAVAAEYVRSGLPVTTLRLGTVYGPWGAAFTYGPLAALKRGRVVLVENGAGISNAVYVDDVVQAIVLAARRKGPGPELCLIRGPDQVTWRQFYEAYETMAGTDSLVDMTLDEVRADARRNARAALRDALPGALGALKRDPEFKKIASQLPFVSEGWKAYRRRRGVSPSVMGVAARAPAEAQTDMRPLIAVPEMMWGAYASRTEFRIDHAREVLGYQPMFDLARGMAITRAWAEWAGLIGPA